MQSVSNDTIGTSNTSPRYWSLAFGQKSVIGTNYDDDTLYDQYWVVDLKDAQFVNEGTQSEPFYEINPLYFMLDTPPSLNTIRMNQIYFGRPEQYIVNTPLYRFGDEYASERNIFSTWAWIGASDGAIYDDGSPNVNFLDNTTLKIGQIADISCKSAMNYDYGEMDSYYLSSILPTKSVFTLTLFFSTH